MKRKGRIAVIELVTCFIVLVFSLISGVPSYADAEKPGKDYTLRLRELLKKSEKNIKKVDGEIKKQELEEGNRQREAQAREHFDRGNALYSEGKLKEAREEWTKTLEITRDPRMKEYVRKSGRK